jgi:hypothetical protein
MMYLRQNTATWCLVGPVLDEDGLPYTTDDLAPSDFKLTKYEDLEDLSVDAIVSHSHQGHFWVILGAGDIDELGRFQITLDKAGLAMPPWSGQVLPAQVYNSVVGMLDTVDKLQVDVREWKGNTPPDMPGTGTGARTIAVTVTDGTDPLEGARVRFTKGAESYVGTTGASGQVTFALDDGTWAVAVTLAGYSMAPTTLAVSADASVTYEMTATSFTPSEPGLVTGYLYCYDEEGQIEQGVTVRLRQTAAVSGTGVGYDSATRTAVSDATGLVQFTGLFPGAKYQIRRETASWYDFPIDAGATDPYALPSILGG